MIKLTIDKNVFIDQILYKVQGIEELTRPTVLQEIAKAAFTITGEAFALAVDRHSAQNPKKMHHVYDWGHIGNPKYRLFVIERAGILSGTLIINTSFLKSKLPVPVAPELLVPGPSGKVVSAKNIFKDKAKVMESGKAVTFSSRKMLTFLGTEGQVFIAPGRAITIQHPGGMQTTNAFGSFMVDWYVRNAQTVMDVSGYYERVAQETAKVLSINKTGVSEVKRVVASITNSIAGGKEIIV